MSLWKLPKLLKDRPQTNITGTRRAMAALRRTRYRCATPPAVAPRGTICQKRFRSMKAVVIDGTQCRVDHSRKLPQLRDYQVLVKPVAVALNPTDWRHLRYGRAKDGCIMGCDYAGVVESVGSAVTKSWSPGDRIFGCAHGANLVNPDDGVFAEYAAVVGDLQMRIPDAMGFAEAATLGLGSITVGQGLFQKALRLELPSTAVVKRNIPVLIYGGGTATGALGIQYACQAGYTVITTCSKDNFAYVKSLGAEYSVDYHDAECGAQIRKYTNNALFHAWDTVSTPQSAQICAEALSAQKQNGRLAVYGTILPVTSPRSDVETISTVMYTVFGKAFKFGPIDVPASVEDFKFGKKFFAITEALVAENRIKPHTHQICKGGLEGISNGLHSLQSGKVKATKLVYMLADTP